MSLLRALTIAAALLASAPAFAQESATVRVTATAPSGRPTLMSWFASHPLPETTEGLIARLNEPNMCSKAAWPVPDPNKPCAIVAYYLVDRQAALRTPQLVFRAIQSVSYPDDPAKTTLMLTDMDGQVRSYGGARVDEPLRPLRVRQSCSREWHFQLNMKTRKCKPVNALYMPFGILGYVENEEQQILTGKVKDAFFSLSVDPQDAKVDGFR